MRPCDAADMFEYAKDPLVGPPCGWKPHENVQETESIIREFLLNQFPKNRANTASYINPYVSNSNLPPFGIILKETGKFIGSVGFKDGFSAKELIWGKLFDRSGAVDDRVDPDEGIVMLEKDSHIELNRDLSETTIDLAFTTAHDTKRFVQDVLDDYCELDQCGNYQLKKDIGLFTINSALKVLKDDLTEVNPVEKSSVSPISAQETTPKAVLCNIIELGYALNPSYWGKGIIKEAVEVLLKGLIWPQINPSCVLITPMSWNNGSKRVAEKVGAELKYGVIEGVTRGFDSTNHDILVYALRNPNAGVKNED